MKSVIEQNGCLLAFLYFLLFTDYWLLTGIFTDYCSLTYDYWLAALHWLLIAYWLLFTNYLLLTGCFTDYWLFTRCCLLIIVYWLLFTWSVRRERGSRRPQVAPLLQPSEKHNKTHEIFENNLIYTFKSKTNELWVSEVFIKLNLFLLIMLVGWVTGTNRWTTGHRSRSWFI